MRFVENRGVKQGDPGPLGPRLFNIFIKDLPEALHVQGLRGTDPVSIANTLVRCLLYADDVLLFSTTVVDLQRHLDALGDYIARLGG